MKSKIARVLIVPTEILTDRRIKCKCSTVGWIPVDSYQSKERMSEILSCIEAVINPDLAFVHYLQYYEKGKGWEAEVTYNVGVKLTPIICYKKRRIC